MEHLKMDAHDSHNTATLRSQSRHPDMIILTYPRRMRVILLTVILAVSVIGFIFPRGANDSRTQQLVVDQIVETFDIPPTQQFVAPPPPSRPSIPVASEDEDLAEDITIDETGLDDFDWAGPPPVPNASSRIKFVPYEVAPEPVGGFKAILKHLQYPPLAQEAGIEGRVIVQAHIDEKGRVIETLILDGMPGTGMNEAAAKAVRMTRFKPAMQRDKPVAVWLAIPISFTLN